MPYRVQFTPKATDQLRVLRTTDAVKIVDQSQRILSVNPTLESRARIKRLRRDVFPPYRLRVDEYRVFYNVEEEAGKVVVYGVVEKSRADD